MQRSDTLAQIQSSINYVMEALTLPDYVNPEDVEQQTALIHLELLSSGEQFPTAEDFHMRILQSIRSWLAPVMLTSTDKVRLSDCRDEADPRKSSQVEDTFIRKDCIGRMLAALSPRMKYVIEQRHGLNGDVVATEKIAQEFGLSGNRIRDIERDALAEMRGMAYQLSLGW